MIPQDTVARILDTARIEDVVGDFVSLKRRGANFVACCPFHNEKTPSFYVSPGKGIFKCFGCGKSGTAVGFVIEHEGLGYVDALKYLARKYGIEVVEKEQTAEEIAARDRSESLMLVTEFASEFFKESLKTPEGQSLGYAYFRSRGLEDETISRFSLGWAPKARHSLLDAARAKGFKEEYLIDTGLCIRHDDGSVSDRFYDRAVFPIHSVSGRVIGFGGRTLRSDKTVAKYVNSPESEIYDKSRTLYGIAFARSAIAKENCCYLVEGYMDVLSMHQLGITNVVASSGTSLTVPQIRMIRKLTENVTVMYDGDSAGIKAALRAIGLVLKEGLNVKVVLIPDGDDPDSYSRKHSLEEVQTFIASASRDFISFKTDMLLAEAGDDPLKRAELINDIADTIALIPDAVKRTVYGRETAVRFDMDSSPIFDRIARSRDKMLMEDRRNEERERHNRQQDPSGEYEQEPSSGYPQESRPHPASAAGGEDIAIAASERELLWMLYNYGTEPLQFESDSEFYDPAGCGTVADFIRASLEEEGDVFVIPSFRKLYDTFFEMYDADPEVTSGAILKTVMDGGDRQSADLVAEIAGDRYRLTVDKLASSMTATASMLVMKVPAAIMVYFVKRLDREIASITKAIASETDVTRQMELLRELKALEDSRNTVQKKLGRVS